ncbi:hypothetical protein NMC42_08010 [Pseudomonas aeruginosa]
MSSEVSAIRQLIEDWRAAVRASDVPRIVSYYAEDIVAFDAILQLQFKGATPTRSTGRPAPRCAKDR